MIIRYDRAKSHITEAERKAINQMIEQGHTQARNKPDTKRYVIEQGDGSGEFTIAIQTKSAMWIGEQPTWRSKKIKVTIEHKQPAKTLQLLFN